MMFSEDDVNAIVMKDDWIKKQLARRISEFTDEKTLHIFLGTWNVAAKKGACRLESWLRPPIMKLPPDVYAIGIQEIVDLNASNVMRDPQTAVPWIHKLQSCLSDDYTLVSYKQLVGIVLCVFARKEHYPANISKVLMASTGVGVMGIGNKGGVAIRFNLYDSTVCILNSHLAAHQRNVQARNDNVRDITDKLRFSPPTEKGIRPSSSSIEDHDYLFWIGDLNYRIEGDIDTIFDRISRLDLAYLLRCDQLLEERRNGAVFLDYEEGEITFPPTYKYQPNTDQYERRAEKKKRSPAWCDRILWRARRGTTSQLFYESAPSLCISDHKPVMAMFQVAVKVLVKEKRNELYQSLVRQLDALENQQIPKIALSSHAMIFPSVHFHQTQQQILTIRNEGEVIIQFHFSPRPHSNDDWSGQPWLSINPTLGIIPPGESIDIEIAICVHDKEMAFSLNARKMVLNDIIILKLLKGCDYFVTISGDWMPSCLASSIEYLICFPDAVRSTDPVLDDVLAIPKEIWRLVDYIFRNGGLNAHDLFTTTRHSTEVIGIIEDLDTNVPFRSQYSVCSMGSTLTMLLGSLCRPVIPIQLCTGIGTHPDPRLYIKQCLMELPLSHYTVVVYVISFLREFLAKRDHNQITAKHLALMFGVALCQYPSSSWSAPGEGDLLVLEESPATTLVQYLLTDPLSV